MEMRVFRDGAAIRSTFPICTTITEAAGKRSASRQVLSDRDSRILQHLGISRATAGRFLLSSGAALHLAAVEAHSSTVGTRRRSNGNLQFSSLI